MFENSNIWKDIGYEIVEGELLDGKDIELNRTKKTSPEFLSNHSPINDVIDFKNFHSNIEQVEFVVNSIERNLKEDELKLDDIVVINLDPLTTKSVVGLFRQKLYDKGINSNLAGVSTSPDIFYTGDAITFTGIYRAKGNEAAMVFTAGLDALYSQRYTIKGRNKLFTAFTRTKAWLRVSGIGENVDVFFDEIRKSLNNSPNLTFIIQEISTIQRDLDTDPEEMKKLVELVSTLKEKGMSTEQLKMVFEDKKDV